MIAAPVCDHVISELVVQLEKAVDCVYSRGWYVVLCITVVLDGRLVAFRGEQALGKARGKLGLLITYKKASCFTLLYQSKFLELHPSLESFSIPQI